MPGSERDRRVKRERLERLRAELGRDLLLTSHEALAWYLEGARTHVSLAGPAVLSVRVERDGDVLHVADNEADRLVAEELLPGDATRIVRVPWQIPPAAAAAEQDAVAESAIAVRLRAARAQLLPAEQDRYRALGRDCAEVLTDALREARPEQAEQALAAVVAAGLIARGIDPLVVLVAGAGRLPFRHPLPTAAPLGERAMVVVCGRRSGLIANVTRWVGTAVDEAPILDVERAFLDATIPGARLDDVFADGLSGYRSSGFDADEWRRHHQGGPTGYAGRDPRAVAGVEDLVAVDQAFAWNPTGPGVKVEDTMLRTADRWEVLTEDPRWPTVEHRGLRRPVTLPYS